MLCFISRLSLSSQNMARLARGIVSLAFLISAMGMVQARYITLNTSSSSMVSSDGGVLGRANVSSSAAVAALLADTSGSCEHLYGFFPCAENIAGYIFQAVIYQYLLSVGGQLVTNASKKLFTMLGTGVFGASLFRVLLNFPRIIFVIMSGVFSSKEQAQQQVGMSIAIYAGSTIFVLTLVWGMAIIFGRRDISETSSCEPQQSISTPLLQNKTNASSSSTSTASKPWQDQDICTQLKETGVTTDQKTSDTAAIMLLSLIPFAMAQLTSFFNTSSSSGSRRVATLIALIVSIASLLSYFIYQLWDPWMQQRSLEYSKYENLLASFLNYVQKQTKGKLVDSKGQPNIPAIGRLFSENDKDDDKSLTRQELQKLMVKIQAGEVQVDKDFAVSEVLKVFDINSDGRISEEEFIEGSKKWIDEAQKLEQNADDDDDSNTKVNKVIREYTKKRREELGEIEYLMGSILKHVRSKALEVKSLLQGDGSPDIAAIQTIFRQFGSKGDDDNSISQSELKQLIQTAKFGDGQVYSNPDETAIKVMKGLDKDGDNAINEHEFVLQVQQWLHESVQVEQATDKKQPTPKSDEVSWEEVDELVYKVKQNGNVKDMMVLAWAFGQPILEIILGVAMLSFLAKPFISSILQLSTELGITSFYISFIIVPLIMNMRLVTSALFPVSQRCSRTASLTFSELYGDVIMNNIIGLTSLLVIVYAHDLQWDYSAEVLIIMVVCGVVGFFAFYTTTYPLWTCIFAVFLYAFSLALYSVVHYLFGLN